MVQAAKRCEMGAAPFGLKCSVSLLERTSDLPFCHAMVNQGLSGFADPNFGEAFVLVCSPMPPGLTLKQFIFFAMVCHPANFRETTLSLICQLTCAMLSVPAMKCIASSQARVFSYLRVRPCQDGILPSQQRSFDPYVAMRIGEALHPGPDQLCLNFAITNPTSIVSKPTQYAELIREHALDVVSASETAATLAVQRQFANAMRHIGFRSKWSVPAPDRVQRSDGLPSLRGKATGVGLFSSWPIRKIGDTIDDFHASSSRIGHFLFETGRFQLQIVVIYGHATSGSGRANTLLLQAALQALSHFDLPYVILGDFNSDPLALIAEEAQDRHLVDLRQLHRQIHGSDMPPTCKGATQPDTAVFSPSAACWVSQVTVLPAGHFDAHNVVLFQMTIPAVARETLRIPLPRPWTDLPIDPKFLPESYDLAVDQLGEPQDLTAWGRTIEDAVDRAYRCTQQENEDIAWHQTKPLPKQFRGRCQPRKPQLAQKKLLTKPPRPGDYSPPGEVIRRTTQCRIKQVRRVQALYRRVVKAHQCQPTPQAMIEMTQEWHAILRCRAFGGCQIRWCQQTPELGPPPFEVPQVGYIGTMLQLLRFQTDADVAFDRKLHKDRALLAQDLDARYAGNRAAFASVREFTAPPLVEMVRNLSEDAILVQDEPNTLVAYCDNAEQFDFAAPVHVGDIPCTLVHRDMYSLQLRMADQHVLPEHDIVTQRQITADPCSILSLLKDFWMPLWNQPNPETQAAPQFQAFVDSLPIHLPAPAIDMDDTNEWIAAVKRLKIPSSRGIDGISSQELQHLPGRAISHVQRIINGFESGFPAWLMTAFTIAVPKTCEIPEPSQVRPITVLAQLYRLWSRVICKQLLAFMSLQFPDEITGFLAHRGPSDAYLRQQWLIELSYHNAQPRSGVTADLLKCFNTISQAAVLHAFDWLGFPPLITRQWYASLQKLCRVWKLGEVCSDRLFVNHGCPEGDSWSVVSILALAYIWVRLIHDRVASCQIAAYADNWTWSATNAAAHRSILALTTSFVQSTQMQIDWRKTWAWATSSEQFALLSNVLQSTPATSDVPRCQNAMDLGAQVTYQGVPNLGKFRNRLEKVHARLLKLQRIPHSLHTKIQLVKGAIFPAVFYGAEILPLGDSHTRKLRTSISNALLGHSHSRNAALALAATPQLLDPFLELVLRVLMAIKRMMIRATDTERKTFFRMAATHSGLSYQCRGPAGVLSFYLSKLGWKIDANGCLHVHAFGWLPLLQTGRKLLIRWLRYAWDTDLLMHACDRKGVPRFLQLNSEDTGALVDTFNQVEQHHILQELSGSFQTEMQKSKWASDATGQCRHCQDFDDRFHRIFSCPASAHIREPYTDTLQFFLDNGADVHELPFLLRHPSQDALLALHMCCPEAQLDPSLYQRIIDLMALGFDIHVYTDGSLMHPAHPSCRYGAYAIVLDTCLTDDQRKLEAQKWLTHGIFPPSLMKLAMARTTGNQTIYRSEFFAVLLAAEWFPNVVIHTDCQSVILAWNQCLSANDVKALVSLENFDLVERLWTALQTGQRKVCKVKAHVSDFSGMDLLMVYKCLGNKLANEAAISACRYFQPETSSLAEEIFLDQDVTRKHLRRLFQLFLDLRAHYARLEALQQETAVHAELRPAAAPNPVDILGAWNVEHVWSPPPPGLCLLQHSAWGRPLAEKVLAWMHEVKWPDESIPHPDDPGISWSEMVVSFMVHSGVILPLKRSRPSGVEYLQTFDSWDAALTFQVGLSELAHTFSNLVLQIRKLHAYDPWPQRPLGFVRSLYQLGSAHQPAGVKTRPVFPHQRQVCMLLRTYLLANQGLDNLLQMEQPVTRVDVTHMCRTWPEGLKHAARGFQLVREWKRTPSKPLVFA